MSAAHQDLGRCSRRAFVAGLGASAIALVSPRAARAEGDRDIAILNFMLSLEHLQAAFYGEAARRGALGAAGTRVARVLGAIERAHVATLTAALGSRATRPPEFDFHGATAHDAAFMRTAVAFEDLGAAAYARQLPLIASPEHVATVAAIHTVEAGHAAWIRLLAGAPPVTDALDSPIADEDAAGLLVRGGFVRPRAGTGAFDPSTPWAAAAPEGPGVLAAFPLRPSPRTGDRTAPSTVPAAGSDGLPWGALAGTTAVVSALVLGGIGLRTRHGAGRRVTVVGADEGPPIMQTAARSGPAETERP